MTSRCDAARAAFGARQCPDCGTTGVVVPFLTVKVLLTESALCGARAGRYRFCSNPCCDAVYFSEDGETFTTSDVRVAVWQKQPFGQRTICYCFAESETTIRNEILRVGQSDAVRRVREQIRASRCACDVRNPQGRCCLTDLMAAVTRVTRALRKGESTCSALALTPSVKLRA